jgi:hypothetical protein
VRLRVPVRGRQFGERGHGSGVRAGMLTGMRCYTGSAEYMGGRSVPATVGASDACASGFPWRGGGRLIWFLPQLAGQNREGRSAVEGKRTNRYLTKRWQSL